MSVEIFIKDQVGEGFARTFPMEAELEGEIVEYSGIIPALRLIAEELVKQNNKAGQKGNYKEVIGICFNSLSFNMILQPRRSEHGSAL